MKDVSSRAVTDWSPPENPQELLDAWNARFPAGTEVAVGLGDVSFIDLTTGQAYWQDGQPVVPVRNVQGDPLVKNVWPLVPGTMAWYEEQP